MSDDKEKVLINELEEEVSQEEIEKLMEEVDRESRFRKVKGYQAQLIFVIAVAFSAFHLYTGIFGILAAQLQRSIHLSFAFVLVYLLYPVRRKNSSDCIGIIDYIVAIIAGITGMYMVINYNHLMTSVGMYTNVDLTFAALGVLFTLEAARRVVGLPILCIAVTFLAYCYFGAYFPGFLEHRGYSVERIITHMYFTTEGIMGIPLGVSSTFIFLFLLFGAFLERTGIAKLFIDVANAIAGWASGGPAKVAVITSALEGTVSGSSVANTVGSGSFTIPMMKRLGYKPEFAAAVEAAASTGGQIMPPIMGAAAFLMAEFIGMPYIEIAKAATVPAFLYFLGILIGVHLEAKKLGLRGMSRSELPKIWDVLVKRGYLFLPLVAIIYVLMEGFTPIRAALVGLGLSILAGMVKKETRMSFMDILLTLETGARGAVGVIIACATAGIIVGSVTLTGAGLKMANGLVDIAGGHLLLTLFFTMIASLILGMGAPTTANYVITSTIAAPALLVLGVNPLAAHMFVFYFGIVADITPPVALAAYAGSGIARSDPFMTGVTATKLAVGAFIIPYIFVMNPQMLLIDYTVTGLTINIITATFGMVGISAAMIGYIWGNLKWWGRIWFVIGGLGLIDPGHWSDVIGAVMLGTGALHQFFVARKINS
jgi:TRAP transporter, 4TM/12TM fusion protein